MPTNWKYIKKLLEKEFLCEKLRGHITYDLTQYEPAAWAQQHFIMKYDDKILLEAQMTEFNWSGRWDNRISSNSIAHRLSSQLHEKLNIQNNTGVQDDIDRVSMELAKEVVEQIAHWDGVYGVAEIVDAIGVYLHTDIKEDLEDQDYFVRALAVLDRRCGKRTLQKFAQKTYLFHTPDWLKQIYRIRFEAENIKYSRCYQSK